MIMIYSDNPQKIFFYHYVEEIISNYGSFFNSVLKDNDMTIKELSVLLRIRFDDITTQHDLVDVFNVSGAYIAKLLKKFEGNEYIKREEDPKNRRKKIVKLTEKGIEKTDELIKVIGDWENEVTSDLTDDEIIILKNILFKIINKED
ncbi:MarR family winged helix-turn-helix transcriptional regulator [Methanobrevibacter sp.]|uniref:MarR family winged helix-turn-helix transcriptional regulator n=1 Tax=Methanobrevibacter sp. TaxID=66852 RepID=UPI0025FDFFC0|nr:winged helix DNA-binding protein [Methanobrevibacter sp.]MBQ6100067.1 winged helix DNA-binding protein [Methanobrevibacter sp.]MBQ6511966.1 winged helix DNA-binding protein [Methanobrevibacter sp.]